MRQRSISYMRVWNVFCLVYEKKTKSVDFERHFFQASKCKIKIEFQKIQLLFSKFKKKFPNFQLQNVEYYDTCIWKL